MLKIIDERIYMVRGDDEVLEVNVSNDGGAVTLGESETLTLTVRELPSKESPVIFASTSAPGKTRIVINHADTSDAEYGEYSADIQLLTADGRRKTVWPVVEEDNLPKAGTKNWKNFILLPEVTME